MIAWVQASAVSDAARTVIRAAWKPTPSTEQALVEIAGAPGSGTFAIIYRDERTGSFDWSVFAAPGREEAGGWRLTQPEARAAAEEALAIIT